MYDCLCGRVAPSVQSASGVIDTKAFEEIIRADVADLLNSRRYASEIPREFQHVALSMMSYGLPDLMSFSIHSSTQQEELRRTIERTIELFEPRLTNVKVSLVEINMDQLSARYRISARIAIHPRPEFSFDTVLRSDIHRLEIRGEGL